MPEDTIDIPLRNVERTLARQQAAECCTQRKLCLVLGDDLKVETRGPGPLVNGKELEPNQSVTLKFFGSGHVACVEYAEHYDTDGKGIKQTPKREFLVTLGP